MDWNFIISNIASALIGLLVGVMFDEPLRNAKQYIVKRFKRWFHKPKEIVLHPEYFTMGKKKTRFLVIEGDGSLEYLPETIECFVSQKKPELPEDIQKIKDEIERQENEKKEMGLKYKWNGPQYALESYSIERTELEEKMAIRFNFVPSDYFTFQATAANLDSEAAEKDGKPATLRQKYMEGHSDYKPIPFLANGFGVALAVITKDKQLILTRRHEDVGIRPGQLDVSVVEALHPSNDRGEKQHGPDLYRTARRGIAEELGSYIHNPSVIFLGFGVDMDYYQWNLIGIALIQETAEEFLEYRTRGAEGKWEVDQFEIIDSRPDVVFRKLKDETMWSMAWAAIYWALVHEWGRSRVDHAIKTIFK